MTKSFSTMILSVILLGQHKLNLLFWLQRRQLQCC